MICKKCGAKIKNNSKKCDECGATIENKENPVVANHVITESHTFVEDKELQAAIQSELKKETDKERDKQEKNIVIIIWIITFIAALIVALYIIASPFITRSNKNTNTINIEDNDWTRDVFILDGVAYELNDKYSKFVKNGWNIDLNLLGYEGGHVLNEKETTSTNIDLFNKKYDDASVSIGFINLDSKPKDIAECNIWSIKVSNYRSETPVNFVLPGNIKNGSTKEEIINAYGKLKENDIFRSDTYKYTTFHYKKGYDNSLDLTVYDDLGLMDFNYKHYENGK